MKNLIRGHIYQLKKDNFFFGCLALSCVSLFVSIRLSLSLAFADAPVMGIEELFNTFLGGGMGTISYPGYYALSVVARILFVMAHISFALTATIYTRNAITGVIIGLAIPNIPKILEMVLGFLRIQIDLDFIKISTHMPSVYAASNDLSSFLSCFVVLIGYLILSIVVGFWLLKHQDIK